MAAFVRSRLASRTLLRLRRCAEGLTARLFLTVSARQKNHNFILRRILMTRISVLLVLLVFCSATTMQAQAPAPKPDPEVKKLCVWVGHWTFDGEQKPGPLGLGGKFTGECNCHMILGGFFLQCQCQERWLNSEMPVLEIYGYDPVNKNFPSEFYFGDGSRIPWVLAITGNTSNWAGKWTVAGKQYQVKQNVVLSPDLTSMKHKAEISADGETWTPFLEAEWINVPPAAKK